MDATADHYLGIILNMSLFCPVWVTICPVMVVMAAYRFIQVENSLVTKQGIGVNGRLHHFLLCYSLTKLLSSVAVIPVKFMHACDFIRMEFVSLNCFEYYSLFFGNFSR
jgi:hypothetical protein